MPLPRATLSLLFATSLASAACQAPAPPSTATATAEQAAPAAASEDGSSPTTADAPAANTASPAPAAAAGQPPITAARPDELLANLPAANAVVLVDVDALSQLASRGLNGDEAPERVRGMLNDALSSLPSPPANTLNPNTTAFAVSWDATTTHLVASPSAATPSAATPAALPPALPTDALFTFVVHDRAQLPPQFSSSLDFLDDFEVQQFAFAVRPDGSSILHLNTLQPDAVVTALGRGQVWVSQALGQAQTNLDPSLQGWVRYANRVAQSLFSWPEITVADSAVTITVPAPVCGGPHRSLLALAFVLTVADFAAADPAVRAVPFVPMQGAIADGCAPVAGPEPTLPLSFGSLAGAADTPSLYAVADLGAILRRALPTGFGLLPFALSADSLDDAFGPRPMGLNTLADGNAHAAYAGTFSSRRSQALVVPTGLHVLAADNQPIVDMRPVLSPAGNGWATPDFNLVARLIQPEPPAYIASALEHTPSAFFAAIAAPALLQSLADRFGETPLGTALATAAGAVFAISDEGIHLHLFNLASPPPSAAEIRAELATALAAASHSTARTERQLAAVAEALDHVHIDTDDTSVSLAVRSGVLPLVAATLHTTIPLIIDTSAHRSVLPLNAPSPAWAPVTP